MAGDYEVHTLTPVVRNIIYQEDNYNYNPVHLKYYLCVLGSSRAFASALVGKEIE